MRVKHEMHMVPFCRYAWVGILRLMAMKPRPASKPHRKHFMKAWREKLGITQDQALGRLGWSQSKISRIESSKIPLTIDDLHAAADAYGVTTFEILNVDPSKEREVVDLLPMLERGNAQQRREIAEFAAFVMSRGKAG